jgi:hypothetical protein
MKRLLYITTIAASLIGTVHAQENAGQEELYQNAELLINKKEYDKARLAISLYQEYYKEDKNKWLKAQIRLIEIEAASRNYLKANELVNAAETLIKTGVSATNQNLKDLDIAKAKIALSRNDFEESDKILTNAINILNSKRATSELINSKIDRLFIYPGTSDEIKIDNIHTSIAQYENSRDKNPYEIVRIKNKMLALLAKNKEDLNSFNLSQEIWIPRDEFEVFKIYILTNTGNSKAAYESFNASKEQIVKSTNPATVAILCKLAMDLLEKKNPTGARALLDYCKTLTRSDYDLLLTATVDVKILILEKKLAEALDVINIVDQSANNKPYSNAIKLNLCDAFIKQKDFKECQKLFARVTKDQLTKNDDISLYAYINGSILLDEGKGKLAAEQFLRAGQTSTKEPMIIDTLYLAGIAFTQAKENKNAIISFSELTSKNRHKYTDRAYLQLYRLLAEEGDYKKSLKSIDTIVSQGRDPAIKEQALMEKGDILHKAGMVKEALKAYDDFAVIYANNKKSDELLFKSYNIHRRQLNDMAGASRTLDKLIEKTKGTSPEIYSLALHHRALVYQMEDNSRESINLWLKYLEFNEAAPQKSSEEVKLQLAAAYQNTENLNNAAAASLYADLIATSSNVNIIETSIINLFEIEKNDSPLTKAAIGKLFERDIKLTSLSLNKVMNWQLSRIVELNEQEKNNYIGALQNYINRNFDSEHYWRSYLLFQKAKLTSEEGRAVLLNSAITELAKVANRTTREGLLEYEVELLRGDKEKALLACLDAIYIFQASIASDNYNDWQLYHQAVLNACQMLKQLNRQNEVTLLLSRIAKTNLPETDKLLSTIEQILTGEAK